MTEASRAQAKLQADWQDDSRWQGIRRSYSAADVVRLRGTIAVSHSLAELGAEKLWHYLANEPFVNALGALTDNQAMQQVRAGLKAIYLSGWQVAADANLAGQMYPDQSLYPADSVPSVVRRINNTLVRADQLSHAEGDGSIDWLQPIVADAEAGFGGVLNAFELMKAMIEAGAAGVHFEDQLASAKKDRRVSEGTGGHGIPLPVHHTGRVPRAELQHVRTGKGLPRAANERLCRAAGRRVCRRGAQLFRHQTPARGGDRIFRRDHAGSERLAVIADGPLGVHGTGSIQRQGGLAPKLLPGRAEGLRPYLFHVRKLRL